MILTLTFQGSLALIVTRNVFSYLVSLGSSYEKSQMHQMTPIDLERYQVKRTPYMHNQYTRVPNFSPFCSTLDCFPDNWDFRCFYKVQWRIWSLRKKIVKIGNSKIPNAVLRRPLRGKIRQKFENIWRWFLEVFEFCNFHSHWTTKTKKKKKRKKKSLKFQFSKYQKIKKQNSLKTSAAICRSSSILNVLLPQGPMLMKTKNMLKISLFN